MVLGCSVRIAVTTFVHREAMLGCVLLWPGLPSAESVCVCVCDVCVCLGLPSGESVCDVCVLSRVAIRRKCV